MLQIDDTTIAYEHHSLVHRVAGVMRTSDERLSLHDLADIAGLSPYYFNRIFRAVSGIPPVEFQNALRFHRAKELLLTSPASITDVCFEIGYESLGTFSSRFKKLVGVGPAEFRHLPDIVAGMNFRDEPSRGNGSCNSHTIANVHGVAALPHGIRSTVFVGVYPSLLAGARPIGGQMLPEGGPFRITGLPYGTWYLLAAALPHTADTLGRLLPGLDTLVAVGAAFEIVSGREDIRRELHFRAPRPEEPPILTSLPSLLLALPG